MSQNLELKLGVTKTERPTWWNEDRTIYSVGISGGKDSTAVLLWMLHESGIPKEKINATFCDTGNEHDWTYAHVKLLSETLHPIQVLKPERGFFELADHKKRFPSTKTRFCTQFLKIYPSQDHVQRLRAEGYNVISVSGVRADESEERKNQPEWDYSGTLLCHQWRPLIRWTIKDVLAIHEKYGVPLNPLYGIGAQRVGCWPCIMSRKSEIRIIAQKFPERIAEIREAENAFEKKYGRYSSFFPRNAVPERFRTKSYKENGVQKMEDITEISGYRHNGEPILKVVGQKPMMVATIDDVVKWSLTGDKAQGAWDDSPQVAEPISCNSGFCE